MFYITPDVTTRNHGGGYREIGQFSTKICVIFIGAEVVGAVRVPGPSLLVLSPHLKVAWSVASELSVPEMAKQGSDQHVLKGRRDSWMRGVWSGLVKQCVHF